MRLPDTNIMSVTMKSNEEIIRNLKNLIHEYEHEREVLSNMVYSWEEFSEPSSDPALQYEQEMIVEKCWDELSKFCKETF